MWVVGLVALLPAGSADAADNVAPVAVDDVASTSRNVPVPIPVLENDSDADGDALTLVDHTDPAHGDVDCLESGLCWYLPATDYFGTDSFTYTISDGQGGTDVGNVEVTIAENGEPQAAADNLTAVGSGPAGVDVLENDSDPDGDPLTLVDFGQPPAGEGSVDCTEAGECTYTPGAFRGDTEFSYTVSDGHGHTATGQVFVSAEAPPARVIESSGPLTRIGISEDLNCSANHELDTAGEWFADTACGTFAVVDDEAFSPARIPAGITSTPWTPVSQSAVLGAGTTGDPYRIVTTVAAGTTGVTLTQTDSYVVGQESYRTSIEVDNQGSARTVRLYRAGDCYLGGDDTGVGAVDPATGSVSCVNADTHRIEQFLPLTDGSHYLEALYSDVWATIAAKEPFPDTCTCAERLDNGAGLQWDMAVAAGGSATTSSLVTFSPDGAQPLVTTKTVDDDSVSAGDAVTYTIHVANPGATEAHLTQVVDDLPAGFAYVPGSSQGLTTTNPTSVGNHLTWTVDATVAAGAEATLTFSVETSDEAGTFFNQATAEATDQVVLATGPTAPVTVTAAPPTNGPPTAVDDNLAVDQDGSGSVDVLANDSDPDGDELTVVGSSTPAHGTVSCTPAGLCTYIPEAGYAGPDSFDYTVSDGQGHTDTGTVAVTVEPTSPTNGPPTAVDDNLTVDQDGSGSVDVLTNDSDPDGDELTVVGSSTPAHGTVSCTPAGVCTYTPEAGYAGPDSFDYTVSDGQGHTDTGMVAVTVEPAPPADGLDLAIAKVVNRDPVGVGNNVAYQITVTNLTHVKARDLVVTDDLPAGFVFRDANRAGCSTDASGMTLTCAIEKLHPNSKVTIRVRGAFTIAGTTTNTATVAVPGDVDEENNTATVVSEVRGESCTIVGTFGDDSLHGTPDPDVICGLDGDDTFDTRGGGKDLVYGNNGDDTFACDREDVFVGGPGQDHRGRSHHHDAHRPGGWW